MSFAGRGGHYWDKSSCTTTTRGEYELNNDQDIVFGSPAVLDGTGTVETPIRKRKVNAYSGVAGVLEAFGIFVEWNSDTSARTAAEWALYGSREMNKDVIIVLRGPVHIKNVGSVAIEVNQTVIPAVGGCEKMTVNTQNSLGKALQRIEPNKRGLVDINPKYEVDNI